MARKKSHRAKHPKSSASPTRPSPQRSTRPTRPLILLDFATEGSPAFMEGFVAEADRLGWQLLHTSFFDGHLPAYVQPRGAIVDALPDAPGLELLRQRGCKLIRLGKLPHPQDTTMPVVLPDYAAAGRLAADHLAERGFRELGYVGYLNREVAKALWEGFRSRANELGCRCELLQLGHEGRHDSVRRKQNRAEEIAWLTSRSRPCGVFTYNDVRAGRLCGACVGSDLSVPEDIAILGYGNHAYFGTTAPVDFSTIDPGYNAQGRAAARLLEQLIKGESVPISRNLVPPQGVIQRHSTDVLAVPHPAVAKALRHIWDHLDQPLSVTEIARQVGVSRSGLDRAFRRHLGRPVNAEIVRKRLERCAELLRSTDLSVGEIARSTGFATETYFYHSFKKAHGVTPRQYRLQTR